MPEAQTVALPKRLPLVIRPENRDESSLKDAKLLNGYLEHDKDKDEYWIFKRPGLSQFATTIAGNGYGVYTWKGAIYRIQGGTIYKNDVALAGAVNGSLNTGGGVYQFESCRGVTPRLLFGNGQAAYYTDGTTVTQMTSTDTITAGAFLIGNTYTIAVVGTTDFTLIGASANTPGVVFVATGPGTGTGTATCASQFPIPAVKGWGYLDGSIYAMNADGAIFGTATTLNDPTNWTDPLNKIFKQIEPDGGVVLAKQLVYIIAIGEWETEVFYDAANASGSPLSPVQGAKINYGSINQDSLQEMDGNLYWLAVNRSSAIQALMLENLKPTIISTKPVERLLGEADASAVYSWHAKYEGHRFYGVTLKNENLTLVYDYAEQMWAQWTDKDGNYYPIVSSTYSAGFGRIFQHETNGKLYSIDSEFTSDDGDMITVDIITPNFDGGTRREKTLKVERFIGDQTVGSKLQVRVNDSDYAADKWSEFREVDMSKDDPMLTDCGSFRRRATHIRHQCNTRLRLQAVELQMDLGVL